VVLPGCTFAATSRLHQSTVGSNALAAPESWELPGQPRGARFGQRDRPDRPCASWDDLRRFGRPDLRQRPGPCSVGRLKSKPAAYPVVAGQPLRPVVISTKARGTCCENHSSVASGAPPPSLRQVGERRSPMLRLSRWGRSMRALSQRRASADCSMDERKCMEPERTVLIENGVSQSCFSLRTRAPGELRTGRAPHAAPTPRCHSFACLASRIATPSSPAGPHSPLT